ncbi:ribosomal protein S5, C-terminal domain-containing protein [Sordaria brevicollis]|uniref:Small ribosomal subunit protein uS5m n=1 Tax=Sordaria brevicollis TaxID=83679 RepID=A0AAE0UAW7_SORBR|nr:ribosomal protein S5, C-terminal domain-containing protein [Sordaria brevicollis]
MSAARFAARSVLSRHLAAAVPAAAPAASAPAVSTCSAVQQQSSQFHSSANLEARKRSRFKSVRAVELGLTSDEKIESFSKRKFAEYSDKEKAVLAYNYPPEHVEAIEAAEAAIDPKDLTIQGRLRVDPYRMPYIDDFNEIQPIIDKRARRSAPPSHKARFMDVDEFTQDLINWADEIRKGEPTYKMKKLKDFVPVEHQTKPEGQWPKEVRDEAFTKFWAYLKEQKDADAKAAQQSGPTDGDILSYILERSSMTDKNLQSNSSLAPALPDKVPGVEGLYRNAIDPADEGLDDKGIYQEVKKRTGMTVRQILDLRTKILVRRRVVNQTRLGKIASQSVIAVAGNGDGWLGLGMAKSVEESIASEKATLLAIQNMQPIARYENRTIFGEATAKVSGTVVRLNSRPPGFGLRVSHRIFEMCRAAGIRDLSAKFLRSRNPMNTVKATYQALTSQVDPEQIAIGRGKKLVDVRKVYYGGSVH